MDGESTVDESNLTGESRLVKKGPGSKVSGGTINSGATPLRIRTTATTNNSAMAKLLRIVEEAQSNRSTTEAIVDSIAQIYTPLIVMLAICMCSFPWIVSYEVERFWFKNVHVPWLSVHQSRMWLALPLVRRRGVEGARKTELREPEDSRLERSGMLEDRTLDNLWIFFHIGKFSC